MEVRRVEGITGAASRRRWSSESGARIAQEAMARGAVVSVIARRHGLTPQQVFTWRREMRRPAAGSQTVSFALVLVSSSTCEDENAAAAAPPMSMVEVALAGAVIRVPSGADAHDGATRVALSGRMILPPGPVHVLVATRPVDRRKGMDGLAALVREQLKADPITAGPAAAARCRLRRGPPIVTGLAGFTRIRGTLLGFTRPEAGWDVST